MKAGPGRRENHRREIQKEQMLLDPLAEFRQRYHRLGAGKLLFSSAPRDFCFARLAHDLLNQVPFIDDQDAGLLFFQNFAADFFILLRDAGLGVEDENGDVAARDRIFRPLDAEEFNRVFRKRQNPEDIETKKISIAAGPMRLTRLLASLNLAPSNAEAQRLIESGAVHINDQRITDPKAEISQAGEFLLKVGKRRFLRLLVTR